MNLFDAVKDNVTTRQAAERYGLRVGHGGMCKCPFHNDRNPSMKVDKRFHCFGCQADGDVINFASRLFSITPREAALRLAEDFGVQYDPQTQTLPVRRNNEISEAEIFRHREAYVFSELADYRNLLMQWSVQYAPSSMDEEFHPLFREAICNLPQVEFQLDVLLSGTDAEKRTVVSDCLREIRRKQEENDMERLSMCRFIESPLLTRGSSANWSSTGNLTLPISTASMILSRLWRSISMVSGLTGKRLKA